MSLRVASIGGCVDPHEENKAAVTELLGEEAARDFQAIIEEEGERARQEKGNGPR